MRGLPGITIAAVVVSAGSLRTAATAPQSGAGLGRLASGDGLAATFGADGTLRRLECGDADFPLQGDAAGGIVVTDVAALLVPIAGERDFAPNASFELDSDHDGRADGWSFVDFWGSGGSATRDSTKASAGQWSVRLDGNGGEGLLCGPIAVEGGREYLLQVAALGTAPLRVDAFWSDVHGSPLGNELGADEPLDPMTFRATGRVLRAPAQAATASFALQKLGAGPVNLDAVRLVHPRRAVRAWLDGPLVFDAGAPATSARQVTPLAGLGLLARVTWRSAPEGIVGALELEELTGTARALDVELVLPLASEGGRFFPTPRGAQRVRRFNAFSEFQELEQAEGFLPFGDGKLATFPLAALADAAGDGAVALGVPPDDRHALRLFVKTAPGGGLVAKWPLGLSPVPSASPGRARIDWYLARAEPDDAFRGALDRASRLFPRWRERRFGAGGTWLAFTDPATLPNPADFGFAVHEGDNAVASDDALGILSFVYVEPWDYWLDLGDHATQPTYADALARLASQQAGGAGYSADQVALARATDVGAHQDATATALHAIRQVPWIPGSGWSCLFSLNPERGLVDPLGRGWPAPFDVFASFISRSYAAAAQQGATLDGTYLDSLLGYFGTALDHREAQWTALATPLTWDRATRTVALWPPAQAAAVAADHAARERAAGRLLMGNSMFPFVRAAATELDYMGIEVDWRNGPESDTTQLFRRVAAFHRPFCLLQNTDFTRFDHAAMEDYLRRCLFYGHYASCFSADASTHPYFEDTTLYERDRGLFQKYVPLVRELDAAGWEPRTFAKSDRRKILVERFGGGAAPLRFTVLHDGSGGGTTAYALTIEKAPLALGSVTSCVDALTGAPLAFTQDAARVVVTDQLAAGGVRMLRVQ